MPRHQAQGAGSIEVKKDARNRVTLPAAEFDYYVIRAFPDGHFELYPRVLADPLISRRTLGMMDEAMTRMLQGEVSEPIDPNAL